MNNQIDCQVVFVAVVNGGEDGGGGVSDNAVFRTDVKLRVEMDPLKYISYAINCLHNI